jgi:GNAT superfamily N-acetyltransferase
MTTSPRTPRAKRRARRAPTSFRKRPADDPKSSTLIIRPAHRSELDTLVLHRRRMWTDIRRWNPGDLDRADPAYRRWVRREMGAHRFFGFVVESLEGRIVGSGAVWLQPAQPRPGRLSRSHLPYILSMYTLPAFRGRGVATRLVEAMVQWARKRGYARVTLHASRLGHPIYQRLGFEDSNEMRLALRGRHAPSGSPRKAASRAR